MYFIGNYRPVRTRKNWFYEEYDNRNHAKFHTVHLEWSGKVNCWNWIARTSIDLNGYAGLRAFLLFSGPLPGVKRLFRRLHKFGQFLNFVSDLEDLLLWKINNSAGWPFSGQRSLLAAFPLIMGVLTNIQSELRNGGAATFFGKVVDKMQSNYWHKDATNFGLCASAKSERLWPGRRLNVLNCSGLPRTDVFLEYTPNDL